MSQQRQLLTPLQPVVTIIELKYRHLMKYWLLIIKIDNNG